MTFRGGFGASKITNININLLDDIRVCQKVYSKAGYILCWEG